MFDLLFEKLRIDARQWKALTMTFMRADFRRSAFSTTLRHGRSGGRAFLVSAAFYLLTGLIFIPIFLSLPNSSLALTLLLTYTMFMIGGLILVEYHTVVLSTEDFSILGFRPISSRTFFAAKLANVFFYTSLFSSILAVPGLIALALNDGFHPIDAFVGYLAVLASSYLAAMVIIVLYAIALTRVSKKRLQNVLAFFQIGLSFLVYTSFFVLPRLTEMTVGRFDEVAGSRWILLLPSSWFSRWIEISNGHVEATNIAMTILSVLSLLAVSRVAFGRLSMDYAASLVSASEILQSRKVSKRRFQLPLMLFGKAHEERVVMKLIRNQFLNDNKFKMAVLGILPLTIFYLLVGVEEGPILNPFLVPYLEIGRSGMLYLLIFLFPMMLRTYVTTSDSYQASWIFYATPANLKRIVLAEKNFLMIFFVLPFLLVLSCVFYYFFQNLLHVLMHLLVLGLLSHMFLQFAFIFSPELPFSRPQIKGRRTRNAALLLLLGPFVIYFLLPTIYQYVYSNNGSYLVFTITILFVSFVLEMLIRLRVEHQMSRSEFVW
jgi:hypothetical protein